MPYVMIQGPFGDCAHITTTNRDLLEKWFFEWVPRLFPASLPEMGEPRVTVHPIEITPGSRTYDWLQDSRAIGEWVTIPRDPALVMAALDEYRRTWQPPDYSR